MASSSRYSRNNLKYLKITQNNELDKIKGRLSNLPDNIEELQKLLKPLLNNVYINEYGENIQSTIPFNIEETTKGQTNIYNIKPDTPNLDTDKYIQFLKCMIKELHKNNTDFANNTGDILTAHYLDGIDETDKSEIDNLKKRYQDLYNLNTSEKNPNNKWVQVKSKKQKDNKYPWWIRDLLDISRKVLYNETEPILNTNNISTLNDDNFIKLLYKRVTALKDCSTNEISTAEQKEYYNSEYNIENNNLNVI